MATSATSFWVDGDEEHQQLAEQFYRGIERTHPHYVTSRARLCGWWEGKCDWAATSVDYYEYRGPSI